MPECPICGRRVKALVLAEIEGAKIEVCENCAKRYGRIISFSTFNLPKKKNSKKKRIFEEEDYILVQDFGNKIKEAREKLGLSREKFAAMLKEKESVIKRIENEEMVPNQKLLTKIEKTLGISLREKVESITKKERKIPKLTLGDIVEIK